MGKYKYYYHPEDLDEDYRIGTMYKGKVLRTILTARKHPRALEVEFPDGKHTIVHSRSFEVSETAIDFYPRGSSITLKKVGYMEDRRTTKWVIICPLKYALYSPDGIREMMENKRLKAGETKKYQPVTIEPEKQQPSPASKLKDALRAMFNG